MLNFNEQDPLLEFADLSGQSSPNKRWPDDEAVSLVQDRIIDHGRDLAAIHRHLLQMELSVVAIRSAH